MNIQFKRYINTIPQNQNLSLIFDPLFYNKEIQSPGDGTIQGDKDPRFLSQLRSYEFDNTIAFTSCEQRILTASLYTRKAKTINNNFSYIKYSDDSDVEDGKTYDLYKDSVVDGPNSVTKDLRYPLLSLGKKDGTNIINLGQRFTLNFFIRLQRPIQHRHNGYPVREKRGIFLTSYSEEGPENRLQIGYRSPYYQVVDNRGPMNDEFKSKFEPFSFVFSFGRINGVSTGFFAENGDYGNSRTAASLNLMTDYKFEFGKMYMITITYESISAPIINPAITTPPKLKIYINGQLEQTAAVPFNPLTKQSKNSHMSHQNKLDSCPLGPVFTMKSGAFYSLVSNGWNINPNISLKNLIFGPSNLRGTGGPYAQMKRYRKRYLNNLDIGLVSAHTNYIFTESEIINLYEKFRYKYI